MADREKVIKGLEQFKADLKPFCGNRADWERFDAGLAMLKEQEAVKPYEDYDGHCVWRCGNCRAPMFHSYREESVEDAKIYAKFCRQCGRPVKWDERE